MAQIAGRGDVCAGQSESCGGVVENCIQPIGRRVAGPARLGVPQRDVIRDDSTQCGRALPCSRMAAIAIRGQRAAVIAVHVAQRAGGRHMRPRQREGCSRMIECGRCPIRGGVADRAVLREARRDVIRDRAAERRGAGPRRQVAGDARGGVQRVIIGHVAGDAGCRRRRDVQSRQSKSGGAMIPSRGGEAYSAVAPAAVSDGK